MMSESVRAFDSLPIVTDAGGVGKAIYTDPKYWSLGRDRNVCVVNVEVAAISGTGAVVTIIAEDASGRIFTPIALNGNTRNSVGVFRVVFTGFASSLRIGVQLSATGVVGNATVTVEYTLQNG